MGREGGLSLHGILPDPRYTPQHPLEETAVHAAGWTRLLLARRQAAWHGSRQGLVGAPAWPRAPHAITSTMVKPAGSLVCEWGGQACAG